MNQNVMLKGELNYFGIKQCFIIMNNVKVWCMNLNNLGN